MRRSNPNSASRHFVSAEAVALAKAQRRLPHRVKRTRISAPSGKGPFLPPEVWHEPRAEWLDTYQIQWDDPGPECTHVLDESEIQDRLQALPGWMLEPLEVIHLASMTRKKRLFPCYGMQWGNTIYLYPIEASLVEVFHRTPKPTVMNEARAYGGRWEPLGDGQWRLHWTMDSIKDFYLNNILIHELGHLLDNRNTKSVARERYAEWFAIEYGYRPTQRERLARLAAARTFKRRHHAK